MRPWVAGLGVTIVLGLSGCGLRYEEKEPHLDVAAPTLRIVQQDEPSRLDPAFIKDQFESSVSGLIHEGLVVFGLGDDVLPGVAESWVVSPDGAEYEFSLRRGASFSDGRPVTSADVRYSFTRLLAPGTNSPRRWVLDRIAGADELTSGLAPSLAGLETPDTHTVRIRLARPSPVFLKMLAMPGAAIIPEGSAGSDKPDAAFDRAPVGAGPWTLSRWDTGRRMEFAPNRGHHGTAEFGAISLLIQSDAAVRRQQFEVGNVDILAVDFAAYPRWAADPDLGARMLPVQELRTDFVGIMCHKKPFDRQEARMGLVHAIKRAAIFENLQRGRGVLAQGPVPAGVTGHRGDRPGMAHDPEMARAMLTEAGAAGERELELWYRDEALNSEIAGAIRRDLEGVGLRVRTVSRDQASFRAAIWDGAPDLFLGSWTLDYPDIENALVPPFHSRNIPRQGNQTRFSDAAVDALLEQAEREQDAARRVEMFQQAEDLIMAAPPWVPLFHRRSDMAHQPWVKGFTPVLMINAERYTSVTLDGAPRR